MNIRIDQLELLGNRILVERDKKKEIINASGLVTSVSGEMIQDLKAKQGDYPVEDPPTGVVVSIGRDVKLFKVGDRVIFSPYSGKELEFMYKRYFLMSEPEPVSLIHDQELDLVN